MKTEKLPKKFLDDIITKNSIQIKKNKIFVFDADRYFSRPTLNIVEGAIQLRNAFLKLDKKTRVRRFFSQLYCLLFGRQLSSQLGAPLPHRLSQLLSLKCSSKNNKSINVKVNVTYFLKSGFVLTTYLYV